MKGVDRRSRSHKTLSDVTAPAPPAGAALHFDEISEDDLYARESLKKKKKKKDPPTTSRSSTTAGAQPRSRSRTAEKEHRKGPRAACREGIVSVSAGDDADGSVRCLGSKSAAEKVSSSEHSAFGFDVRIKEESGTVGRCGGDVPEAEVSVSVSEEEDGGDGDGEPAKPTNRVAGAPYRCVAGRTRTRALAGKKNRVSHGQYFNEEEEEEEELTEFTVLDGSKKASGKGRKGKGEVSEILVNKVESSVNVKDDKAEIARRRESGENVRSGRGKTERASQVGGETTENVGREKFEMVSRRGGELNNVKAEESESVSRRGAEEGSEVHVKSKYGIPLLVTGGSEKAAGYKATSMSQSSGPAGRTRSRFRSSASEKLKKLGTLSKPLCLDEDDPEANDVSGLPSSGGANLLDSDRSATMDLVLHSPDVVDTIGLREREEDNGSSKHAHVDKRKGEGRGSKSKIRKRLQPNSGFLSFNCDEREGTGNGRVQMKLTSKRRKTVRSLKDNDFFKILKDTVWNYDKKLPEELIIESESQCETWQNLLLPIFCFEDEKPEQVEKSEYEKEIDDLWAELDLALDSNNISTMIYQGDEAQTVSELEMKSDPFSSCSKGKHQFILDEQIGMICKLCSFVEVHIKDIMPPWALGIA